ncbi:MAG: hypothetical protein FH751_15805 [Firmicutes bacterium]|nr:hypothetical protein [Bacillota bacterium]
MSYINAQNVLPKQVIKIIQKYIDGEFLYIPRKNENKKSWGEKSGTKEYYKKRNKEIFNKYISGITIMELTQKYYLSQKSIRRIIGKEKTKNR